MQQAVGAIKFNPDLYLYMSHEIYIYIICKKQRFHLWTYVTGSMVCEIAHMEVCMYVQQCIVDVGVCGIVMYIAMYDGVCCNMCDGVVYVAMCDGVCSNMCDGV